MALTDLEHWQQLSHAVWLQLHQKIVHLLPQHFPTEDSEQLAILLIQHLTHSVKAESLSAFWNHCQEYGEAVDFTSIDLTALSPALALPDPLPVPCFTPGTQLRWKPLSEDLEEIDTGIVIGHFYAPSQRGWKWKYLILLDRSAYSRQFCVADTAWEDDLELLAAGTTSEYSA